MFTVLFALARTVGWIAQWKEMIEDPHQKIGRPRQLYTGAKQRDYVLATSGRETSRKGAVRLALPVPFSGVPRLGSRS